MEHILARVPRANRVQAAQTFSLRLLFTSTLAGAVLGPGVRFVIVGLYCYLILRITGGDVTFFQMLSLVAWTSFPSVFGTLAAIAVVVVPGPHIALSSLDPTSLTYLLGIHPGTRLYLVASRFWALILWTWGLGVYVFMRLYRYRLDRTLLLVLAPIVNLAVIPFLL
jgi:uncharacterized membrane protein